ncbi:hypothetical protein LO772_33240 [Yinghuangia sp. ASG 101]|uniref:hypothetical protein n=1 Tax=Yinghuangia sp. ASG 101 TaxID=2896848 RepID=UPI001E2E2E55|nr:hypothetical protein [Yinghuangia sp. ASG 101]UGQ11586.1 hypothetical protein LO772_33240 [Yinghuangia sp. ASG 101]
MLSHVFSRPRHSGAWTAAAVAIAVAVTLWWPIVGMATENFGSDCVRHFGEFGSRTDRCAAANDAARTWLPRMVAGSWIGVALAFPRPRAALLVSSLCLAVAVGLGATAMLALRA